MTDTNILLIPDLDRLRQRIALPPPPLGELLARFRQRLDEDAAFRAANLYLPALLGEEWALREAKTDLLREATRFRERGAEDDAVEHHTWCVAPHALRTAVFHHWLDHHHCWTPTESRTIAQGLLHFCYEHAVAVLRARAPVADNQSLSLALTCAVVGHAFRDLADIGARARALHEFGLRRVALVLGLAPRDGYLFEGSTYQSHVVSPLVMWTAAFLSQLNGLGALAHHWPPVGATLLDILRVETLLGSAGLLLPPWDNYGWQPKVNLAAIAYYASATGRAAVLADAPEVWDRPQQFIAWGRDDRMWALIYWPDRPIPPRESATITSWSLPRTAAAIDHPACRARLMLMWDNNSSWLQGLARVQVNPNHVAYELDGKPVFADGTPAHSDGFLEVAPEAVAAPLNTAQRELTARQFGSIARWANAQHYGLIGAANTVFLDDDSGYFPPSARHGQLCFEEQTAQRHVTTAECVEYFRPRYDLTRARRTIAMNADGVCWIVDDVRAASSHTFTWQVYVRLGCQLFENCLSLRTGDGLELTMAWLPVESARLDRIEAFPAKANGEWMVWPDDGSERLRLVARGRQANFVVCLVPWRADGLTVRAVGPDAWRAEWSGGSDRFTLPAAATSPVIERPDEPPEALCDLGHEPFDLSDEPDEVLLHALCSPRPEDWRRTTRAMQTLAQRDVPAALPLLDGLLRDPSQRYQVHSVAAWCLGRTRHRASWEYLRYLSNSPETNTALRARWAAERMAGR